MSLSNLLGSIRQWRYPKEFRIPTPTLARQARQDLTNLVNRLTTPTSRAPSADGLGSPKLVVEVATALWRLREKLVQPGTDQPREEMRSAYRYFESAWNTLTEAGLEILGHDGESYHAGMALEVLAFQPTPGIARQIITETTKPSIYYQGHLLQMGVVIVGIPEQSEQLEYQRADQAPADTAPATSGDDGIVQHSSQTTKGGPSDEQGHH